MKNYNTTMLHDESSMPRLTCYVDGQFVSKLDKVTLREILDRDTGFTWLDIRDPIEDDMIMLREVFGFHPLALEDVLRHHERPKVEAYTDTYFMVFTVLESTVEKATVILQPMYVFIGKDFLVSAHHGAVRVIEESIQRWRKNAFEVGQGGGALLYHLLDAIVDDYFPVLDQFAERVEVIEELIFERFEPTALQEVFALKRDLLGIRRIIAPERDVLNVLLRREVPIFDLHTIQYLQDVYDHVIRITDSIDTYRDLLSSATDSFLSIQSNQLNQIVKVLTITSIVLMSCALIAGIYGMNFEFMPELHWRYGYPFALFLMVMISGGLIGFFRWKKWL